MIDFAEFTAAIEAGADADNPAITAGNIKAATVSSKHRIGKAVNIIKRFVEALPEGTTVDEIRERLDDLEASFDLEDGR